MYFMVNSCYIYAEFDLILLIEVEKVLHRLSLGMICAQSDQHWYYFKSNLWLTP